MTVVRNHDIDTQDGAALHSLASVVRSSDRLGAQVALIEIEQSDIGLPHRPPGFHVDGGVVTGLSLRNCGLTSVPDAIGALTSLRDLDLTDNALTTLPHAMERLTSLERLSVDGNRLDRR